MDLDPLPSNSEDLLFHFSRATADAICRWFVSTPTRVPVARPGGATAGVAGVLARRGGGGAPAALSQVGPVEPGRPGGRSMSYDR